MKDHCPPEFFEIIDKYMIKPEHRALSNRKLAQLMIGENRINLSFNVLRQYISVRKSMIKDEPVYANEFDGFPEIESLHVETPVYIFPKSCNNVLIISDLHVPYHSNQAIRTTLRYAKEKEINTLIINGDGMDCYTMSRWQKDYKLRDFHKELNLMREFLTNLRNYLGNSVKIVYKFGNHEDRYMHKIQQVLPEFANDEELTLDKRLKLDSLGIEYVASKQRMQLGKLAIIHGHEYYGGSGGQVNTARNYLLKAFGNVTFGHFHRTQDYTQRTIQGSLLGAYAIGCLCALTPDYFPFNNWNHGFGHVTLNDDGQFRFNNKKVIGDDIY